MKDLFGNLWEQLNAAGAPARWAIASVLGLILAVGGFSLYSAKNPHYEPILSGLDEARFKSAAAAIAGSGIRWRATNPPGPYTIFVERSRVSDAMSAIHQSPDYSGPARGISGENGGAASVFDGQKERDQRAEKRRWEEAELQLEGLQWVSWARVTVSTTNASSFLATRHDQRRASAVLGVMGNYSPDIDQRRMIGSMVANTVGVNLDHVVVTDQLARVLFDGSTSSVGNEYLEYERNWQIGMERRLQSLLDQTFGAGLTVIGVSGEWRHTKTESVENALQPASKPASKRSRTMEDPLGGGSIGGPAGTAANLRSNGNNEIEDSNGTAMATSDEKEEQYAFGAKTTHTISNPHDLVRMTISLVVDESLEPALKDAEELVKNWANFNQARDSFAGRALPLALVERDDEGAPILPEAEEAPAPANPQMEKLLEHGVEIVAALAFLMVLLRSLKSAKTAARRQVEVPGVGPITLDANGVPVPQEQEEEEIDLDLLARKHVEDLLESDPEKVSALLSRWALGETQFAGSSAGSED